MKKFKELFKTELSPGRYVVVSRTMDGKVSIAQLIRAKNSKDETIFLFLKNSLVFDNDDNFNEFRDALSKIDLKEIDKNMSLQIGDNDKK